jgi:hypothetical protein
MMTSQNLANLAKTGQLKAEAPSRKEFEGLVRSARARLKDAHIETLSIESRFDLGYNASHALALAALRWHGYRSENRYIVFQCLQHTLDFGPAHWRILALCHERRNLAEYEGHLEIDEQLIKELIQVADLLLAKVSALAPLP